MVAQYHTLRLTLTDGSVLEPVAVGSGFHRGWPMISLKRHRGMDMSTAHDVAAYILENRGPMTTMKLQKLVYYSQAWSLVWDERPIFEERIEAWANGPVVRVLYNRHRGFFQVSKWSGDPGALDKDAHDTIDEVLRFYGDKSSQWLVDLTHRERPWREAREGLQSGERGDREITLDAMADYYGSL
ncbi:MAG: type II toxin-antitoxin system antitoxin SocA domain-containing protein [Planctomycetota bacterium]